MNRLLARIGVTACLALVTACPSWGQKPAPSAPTSQPSSGSSSNRGNSGSIGNQTQQNRASQLPMYVEGQVINENGQPPADSISVKLSCGLRTLQTIKSDIKGYFRFTLGLGNQANTDFSAADEAPSPSNPSGINMPGGFGAFGSSSNSLTGCDIRISSGGYLPLEVSITDTASLGVIEVGVLQLRRVGTAPTGSVSATSLLVPSNARKEYEEGVKELHNNRLPQAQQHLERAVGAYDKYAAAWTQLGQIYAVTHEADKARQAFEKAIAADPKFAPPYVSLGALQLEHQDYEGVLESIGKAVAADPAITAGVAGYLQGVANFQLDRVDAALASLLQAEKGPHANIPQLHVILADIYVQKGDSSTAATHMRAYMKEAPQGHFAAEMQQKLDEIDHAASNSAAGHPAIAP
jgi:tetratricopeptide (TPR) repeat protein